MYVHGMGRSLERKMLVCLTVGFILLYSSLRLLLPKKVSFGVMDKDCIAFTMPYPTTDQKRCRLTNPINGMVDVIHVLSRWRQEDCRENLRLVESMYQISAHDGQIVIKDEMFREKVLGWLSNDRKLYQESLNQTVVSVYNKYTREETVFNPLRSKRPTPDSQTSDLSKIQELHLKTMSSCDFCKPKQLTAEDRDGGRMETELSITAANMFRYEGSQQLILLKDHDAIGWNLSQIVDMFSLGERWLKRENTKKPLFVYPVITWDLLPPSGASQFHPHIQAILTPDHYPGSSENWRRAAIDYHKDQCRNFFTDFISIHDMFGLTVRYKSAVAIATLTPKKENEVVIIGKEMDKDYLELLYAVLRAYIDDKELYALNLALTLPPLSESNRKGEDSYYSTPTSSLPAVTRVITRGRLDDGRSDISSLELLVFSNVNSNPFTLIGQIRQSVKLRLTHQ